MGDLCIQEGERAISRGVFTDRCRQPTPEEIQSALGSVYPLWERLTGFIATRFRIEGQPSFWGPEKSGWNLRFRLRSKSLVALYPQKERIFAQVVLGKAQAENGP